MVDPLLGVGSYPSVEETVRKFLVGNKEKERDERSE